MGKKSSQSDLTSNISRRKFLGTVGMTTAGFLLSPYIKSAEVFARNAPRVGEFLSQVAVTRADNYDRSLIKQKIQHLFESLGGISDVVGPGKKVAIKINLTGGSGSAYSSRLQGVPIGECMWTHPEVLRATGELIIDSGVSANNIYIVEALWDDASFNNFGYRNVQQDLGVGLVNLNQSAPYSDFMDLPVPGNFFYNSFTVNGILGDVDVYVSIPKMKQHYQAGVTHSIKNQVGMVPIQFYMLPGQGGSRTALHYEGEDIGIHLPHSISDLNLARPVNLAVIDGIKNAVGGEGAWNPTFQPSESHVLLAGKDPVAADSIASYLMGNDPEAQYLQLPDGGHCDNYLEHLHQKGMGTNRLDEIELVGDGADIITHSRPVYSRIVPSEFILFQNFPNPFNASTIIKFYLPEMEYVTIRLYDITGQQLETLLAGKVSAGQHELRLMANGLASGVYLYRMQAGHFSDSKMLIYQK